MEISNDVKYVGVNDHDVVLFENQFDVPLGMAYNSYVILDDKIAVMDTTDRHFGEEWLSNVKKVLNGRNPDYLVVQHMEPDHSSSINLFMNEFKKAQIVSSAQAFNMMKNFYGDDFKERQVVVTNGSTLSLGKHELTFVTAPMVHWPEVIMTYDAYDKILFAADGFGKFGANDVVDPEGWDCEARRYYFGIVGKYGVQVQAVLKKAATLDIKTICSLHGPVLSGDLSHYLKQYDTWSSYKPENEGIVVSYTSVYGNTEKAAKELVELLKANGAKKVVLQNIVEEDLHECIEDAFRYDTIVFMSTTYNMSVFPAMRKFIEHLAERNYQNRRVAFVQNGSWAPNATKVMKGILAECKNLQYVEKEVTITSALNDASRKDLEELAKELVK